MPRISATAVRILLLALLLIEATGVVFASPPIPRDIATHDAGHGGGADASPCHGDAEQAPSEPGRANTPHAACDDDGCRCLHGCSIALMPRLRPLMLLPRPTRHDAHGLQVRADPAPVQPNRPPIAHL
ncbi:CopL family metal-binding regulatory protein [Luteimonas sp. TWI1416]|uniref:CopL family metal-binding regulatory protein n=1 Tax=unclassified Luteimonas TaxID=2629088 RepID=UPI0032079B7C